MSHKDPGSLQHQAEHARSRRQSPIIGYLMILFAAAFLLLLLAYFQQQRANSERYNPSRTSSMKTPNCASRWNCWRPKQRN